MAILIDFTDTGDEDEPTVTIELGDAENPWQDNDTGERPEVNGPDPLGGYTIQGITGIYQAVSQVDSHANRQAEYVAERLQDAAHHGRLYLPSSWRISLVREG